MEIKKFFLIGMISHIRWLEGLFRNKKYTKKTRLISCSLCSRILGLKIKISSENNSLLNANHKVKWENANSCKDSEWGGILWSEWPPGSLTNSAIIRSTSLMSSFACNFLQLSFHTSLVRRFRRILCLREFKMNNILKHNSSNAQEER